MPTYEYECTACAWRFERSQRIGDDPVAECPACGGSVRRLVSRGTSFVVKAGRPSPASGGGRGCTREQSGRTCCGRAERCGSPACGESE